MGFANAIDDIKFMNEFFSQADKIAADLGADRPSVEHFVLSALDMKDDSAQRAFTACGADAQALKAALAQGQVAALQAVGISGTPEPTRAKIGRVHRSTGAGQDLFARAVELSKETKPSKLRSAHLLLAAGELEYGTFPSALATLRIDRADLARAARQALA